MSSTFANVYILGMETTLENFVIHDCAHYKATYYKPKDTYFSGRFLLYFPV